MEVPGRLNNKSTVQIMFNSFCCLVTCEWHFCTQAFMSSHVARVAELLDFVKGGLTSNFWGLGCPPWCGSATWTSLILAYFSGLASGLFLAVLAVLGSLYLCGFVRVPVVPSSTFSPSRREDHSARLQGYLHGL